MLKLIRGGCTLTAVTAAEQWASLRTHGAGETGAGGGPRGYLSTQITYVLLKLYFNCDWQVKKSHVDGFLCVSHPVSKRLAGIPGYRAERRRDPGTDPHPPLSPPHQPEFTIFPL